MLVKMEISRPLKNLHPHLDPHQHPDPATHSSRIVGFTTPENYAGRLSDLLTLKGWTPLWCPTVNVEPTPSTISSIQHSLSPPNFSAIAFTSRAGISSFSQALAALKKPILPPYGDTLIISALGKDSQLLNDSFINQICENPDRIKVLIPHVPTPTGLVESLGLGHGRRVLCPVPVVVGLQEPTVVPDFLRGLERKGWVALRVDGYETRWAGEGCAGVVLGMRGGLDAIVFTSTAEVEGMLKSLSAFGLDWVELRKRWPNMVVAAHGPVTAAGAERLGVAVDVVSSKFGSFDGVVEALDFRWKSNL